MTDTPIKFTAAELTFRKQVVVSVLPALIARADSLSTMGLVNPDGTSTDTRVFGAELTVQLARLLADRAVLALR